MGTLSGFRLRDQLVVVVGGLSYGDITTEPCPVSGIALIACGADQRQLKQVVGNRQPQWILLADGLDEDVLDSLVHAARAILPTLRLAMVGPSDNVERCERWARRGCGVYLA